MGKLEGRVAFVTGAARGQGRNHALRLAAEGADIIALDIGADLDTVGYPLGTAEELDQTAELVKQAGRQIVAGTADVRDPDAVSRAVAGGVDRLGRLDIVVANAAVCSVQPWDEITPALWNDVIATNLTGSWNTCAASIPHLIAAGGGSMILISSTAGLKGMPFLVPYSAAKHGVVGLMRALANELASHRIRVNTVHPTGVATPMAAGLGRMPGLIEANPGVAGLFANSLPVEVVECDDVSNAVAFLASDEARFVTGLTMTVDAGASAR